MKVSFQPVEKVVKVSQPVEKEVKVSQQVEKVEKISTLEGSVKGEYVSKKFERSNQNYESRIFPINVTNNGKYTFSLT